MDCSPDYGIERDRLEAVLGEEATNGDLFKHSMAYGLLHPTIADDL